MGRTANISVNILCIIYIDANRLIVYNKAIMEEVPVFDAPRKEGNTVAVSKAQQKAVTKYVKNKYDRFGLTMPKGDLDAIKAHAEARGRVSTALSTAP
ncbi:hypothetical protein M5E87_20210 [Flavonifractor plautii]|nr:hypothetical protein M5E87_20210 [Flavonifractor plautii]